MNQGFRNPSSTSASQLTTSQSSSTQMLQSIDCINGRHYNPIPHVPVWIQKNLCSPLKTLMFLHLEGVHKKLNFITSKLNKPECALIVPNSESWNQIYTGSTQIDMLQRSTSMNQPINHRQTIWNNHKTIKIEQCCK